MFKNSKVLVTGGTGLIGRPLVDLLIQRGAKVRVVSLDKRVGLPSEVEFLNLNLMVLDNCLKACDGMDYVFHLAGVKGSPAMTAKKPASFFVPTLTFNTQMMEAARQSRVKHYLYTSSIGVYSPAEKFTEDEMWNGFPSPNDKFAGWAKRMGELQAEAYQIEYNWNNVSVVRPANVYGPFDSFDANNAMVIPSLIARALSGENPFKIWGDGSQIRDFIHAKDVANGMLMVVEKKATVPVNLGSGEGVSIKTLVELIVGNLKERPRLFWDLNAPSGDKIRLMDITRAKSFGWMPLISIEKGIQETMEWYRNNKQHQNNRYNVFTENIPAVL